MVIEHEPGDLTCTVSAEVPLAELQATLARGGQMLALDPPAGAGLTVGEAFATAAFDPEGLCNPGKAFPTPRLCGEVPGPYRRHPAEREGVERW